MRLIDADALSVEVDKSKHHNPHSQGLLSVNHTNEHDHFIKMIYDAPTVDAVEVVRCKDCLFAEKMRSTGFAILARSLYITRKRAKDRTKK